ncbi:MAG: bacteriohemerythrin [Bacillota bacterium]
MIEWTPDLSVGIAEIDRQHQELFGAINKLLEACKQRTAKENLSDTLKFLEHYVVDHFHTEETTMIQYDYPDQAIHREMHQQFVKSLAELRGKLENEGPGIHIVVMTNQVVVGWLTNHIRKADQELGRFLKAAMGK